MKTSTFDAVRKERIQMEKIGFIGLGIMGGPMAGNLLKAGCQVYAYDLSRAAVERVRSKGAIPAQLQEMAACCSAFVISLPNGQVEEEVLFGEEGLAQFLEPESLVIDTSSITPDQAKSFGSRLSETNVFFLDAPVSGGEPGAIQGTLSFMVGGKEAAFFRAQPLFKIMGSSAVLMGNVGAGSVTKLANQVIVNLTIAAVSEAMVLACKAGVDPEKVYQAIRGGLAGSTVLENKAPMMFSRNFKPGGKLSINRKDIGNVISAAHSLDVPVPLSAQLFEIMQVLKVQGCMDDDHSAIVKYFEHLAGVKVKKGDVQDV